LKTIEDKTVCNSFLSDEDKAGTTRKVFFVVAVSLIGLIGFGLLGKLLDIDKIN